MDALADMERPTMGQLLTMLLRTAMEIGIVPLARSDPSQTFSVPHTLQEALDIDQKLERY
jgi:hypothetical protein